LWSNKEVEEEDIASTRVLFTEDYDIPNSEGFSPENYAEEMGAHGGEGPQNVRWFWAFYRDPDRPGLPQWLGDFMLLPFYIATVYRLISFPPL
jgi:hypothetical protein